MLNISKNISINLTKSDVQEIIADYVTKSGYKCKASDVVLNVGQDYVGYGMCESPVSVFRGCTVNIKEEVG